MEANQTPPPVPFFAGRTIVASERDGLLIVSAVGSHAFRSPSGVFQLQLPLSRLVSAEWNRTDEGAELILRGAFARFGLGNCVKLAPLHERDARGLVESLTDKHELPRPPLSRAAHELSQVGVDQLVITSGTYNFAHCEMPDFEGVALAGDSALRAKLLPGSKFVVTGFVSPGTPPGGMPCVGYNGPTLEVLAIEQEVLEDDVDLKVDDGYYYADARLTGHSVEYYQNGRICSDNAYREGIALGYCTSHHQSGRISFMQHEIPWLRQVIQRHWFENGQLKSKEIDEVGYRIQWSEWNEAGELLRSEVLAEPNPLYRLWMERRTRLGLPPVKNELP